MTPAEIEKWVNEIDLSQVCDGWEFNALMLPVDFWQYVEDGGSIRNPLALDYHGRDIEITMLPVYDPEVVSFFHITSTSVKLMCRHNFNAFKRAYLAQGGTFDF